MNLPALWYPPNLPIAEFCRLDDPMGDVVFTMVDILGQEHFLCRITKLQQMRLTLHNPNVLQEPIIQAWRKWISLGWGAWLYNKRVQKSIPDWIRRE